jgi:hypothetical protein
MTGKNRSMVCGRVDIEDRKRAEDALARQRAFGLT